MKPPAWRRLTPLLLAVAALAAWAVPGSTAVTALRAQRLAMPAAGQAVPACDPTASLRPAGPPQVTPGSFMARIRARGYLIAGVDQNSYHFGYLSPLTGKIEGFDIDMVRAVAAAIFGNPDKVQYKAISDAQRIPDIQSGAVDIVAHTMTINCQRLQQADFSTVYYDAGQRVLVGRLTRQGHRRSRRPEGLCHRRIHLDRQHRGRALAPGPGPGPVLDRLPGAAAAGPGRRDLHR